MVVDVVVENTATIADFSGSVGATAYNLLQVSAADCSITNNVLNPAALPSAYDMNLFGPTLNEAGEYDAFAFDLRGLDSWIHLRAPECYATGGIVGGVFASPLEPGRHVIARLTLNVAGRVGTYRVFVPDGSGTTPQGDIVRATSPAFTITVGGQ